MPVSSTFTLNDGTTVPWLAFGTGTALFSQDAAHSVLAAIQSGITHLDGAQAYGNEESLGKGIALSNTPRSELFITTKLHARVGDPATVKETLQESLKKLGTDHVDLFLVHSPNPSNKEEGKLKRVWQQMELVKKEGLAKSIGVSNFRVEDLREILDGATVIPSVNQIELHPYVWKAAEPIVNLCKEQGIVTASYGGLTPIVRAAGGPVDSMVEAARERVEKATGQSIASSQILTKWILQKGALVVTTTSKPDRIKVMLKAIDLPDLTKEEMEAIDKAGAELHKRVYMRYVFGE